MNTSNVRIFAGGWMRVEFSHAFNVSSKHWPKMSNELLDASNIRFCGFDKTFL